jgi:hypothetical protein
VNRPYSLALALLKGDGKEVDMLPDQMELKAKLKDFKDRLDLLRGHL